MITTSKQITLAAAGGLVSLLLATQAFAYSAAVINACTGDYLAYCSAYDENSAKGARCMRAAAAKLTQGCADALVGAGEISKGEANRLRGKR